jgi:glycosyltransferase involved in cell wall biosynthesis
MRPVRVLELIVSTGLGGGPRHVYDLVVRLPRGEFAPRVGGPDDGPYFERFGTAGVPIERLRVDRLSPTVLWRVVRTVLRQQVDVIHSHGKGAGLYGRLGSRLTGRPSVHTFHGVHVEGYRPVVRDLYVALERTLGRWSRAVIALSEGQRAEVLRLGFASPGRCVVVPNGIDLAELDSATRVPYPRSAYGALPGELIIGCIARFDPVKRLVVLLDTTARLRQHFPNVRLVLVGSGPLESSLRCRAARLGIERHVSFQGSLPDALRCYSEWDVYATMSSREGLPYAVLEAMASGLAVVASDVPGHREVIRHGVTGFLVPAETQTAAAAIQRLFEDDALRKAVGAAARTAVERDFTVERMVERIGDLYRQVVNAEGRDPQKAGRGRDIVG